MISYTWHGYQNKQNNLWWFVFHNVNKLDIHFLLSWWTLVTGNIDGCMTGANITVLLLPFTSQKRKTSNMTSEKSCSVILKDNVRILFYFIKSRIPIWYFKLGREKRKRKAILLLA